MAGPSAAFVEAEGEPVAGAAIRADEHSAAHPAGIGPYAAVGDRFLRIEKETGLEGFGQSAYFHHMGGPTSPLGNRDYLLEKGGTRRILPWIQFAINPCDTMQLTKVELQGVVMPEGAPRMLDGSLFVPPELELFSEIRVEGGTTTRVANIITAGG